MTVFRCKSCGAPLEIDGKQSIVTCDHCDVTQTLPRLENDRIANLYDRANHFRRNKEFDKATGIYESILSENTADAEAYWSLVLCRYGIEYVEDPTTHKRIPTVNRAQFTSVFDDENYKSALAYADNAQRAVYEQEAKTINEIQKGILAISQKEDPFDVFICYKESDEQGNRTTDSVLATDLYNELIRNGFKVFFARITLEDKLGVAYEPYIFAALNSAKVMVVLGTRPEHFNAVWVKNEWSRYLALIKQGQRKVLIPAYKGMDPYDLPEEFSHLQAQDMNKIGFLQDLTRGIGKIVEAEKPKEVAPSNPTAGIEPLLKRAYMFLEDGDWAQATAYCERVLDLQPVNADAYLGKLMADMGVKQKSHLIYCNQPLENNKNYQKTIRFAGPTLINELRGYNDAIKQRLQMKAKEAEAARQAALAKQTTSGASSAPIPQSASTLPVAQKEAIYQQALLQYNSNDISQKIAAEKAFASLGSYKDSAQYLRMSRAFLEGYYEQSVKFYNSIVNSNSAEQWEKAVHLFTGLGTYQDSAQYLARCQTKLNALPAGKQSADSPKRKSKKGAKSFFILLLIAAIVAGALFVLSRVLIANGYYCGTVKLFQIKEFTVPDGVTEISEISSFSGCKTLQSVTLPDSVTILGDDAFFYCESLTSIDLPDSVEEIGSGAFAYCTSLTEITIPDRVEELGYDAFAYCTSLTSVTLPGGITYIGESAFYNCPKLESITFGGTMEEWENIEKGDLWFAPGYSNNSVLYYKVVGETSYRVEAEIEIECTDGSFTLSYTDHGYQIFD